MEEPQFIQYLVQGGAVGIAIFALWIIYRMQNGQTKRMNEVVEKNTLAFIENAKAQNEHSSAIKELSQEIRNSKNSN